MEHEAVLELIDEMSAAFLERVRGDVPDSGEIVGVILRALERGRDRLDTYGDLIVNAETPPTDAGQIEQLQMLYSGVVQVAVAAAALLETLPTIPISGYDIMTHDEHN